MSSHNINKAICISNRFEYYSLHYYTGSAHDHRGSLCTRPPPAAVNNQPAQDNASPNVVFNDTELKSALLKEMKTKRYIDQNATEITEADALKLTSFRHSYKYGHFVKDLKGIEKFTNLTLLDLAGNDISEITPLANLKNLNNLSLTSNKITDIAPLQNLNKMEQLFLSANKISDISPIKDLTNLTSLLLSNNNKISNINLISNFTKLRILDIEELQLDDISMLKNLTNLQTLSFAKNKITDISPLKNLTKLSDLNISNNKISDITPLQNLTKLQTLKISKNPISNIDALKNLTSLTEVQATFNELKSVPSLENLTNLRKLLLDYNKIDDISLLNKAKSLQELYLGHNNINAIPDLSALTKLKRFYIDNNKISTIDELKKLTSLEDLILSHNQIEDISPVKELTNLKRLQITYNKISDFSAVNELTKLEELTLTANKITDISALKNMRSTSLKKVDIQYQKIEMSSSDKETPLNLKYADKMTFKVTGGDKTGTVANGKFILSDSQKLPYKGDVEIKFDTTNVGNGINLHNGKYSGTVTLKLNVGVPWTDMTSGASTEETIKGKMTYVASDTLAYEKTHVVKQAVDGKKVTTETGSIVNGAWVEGAPHVETTPAQNGITAVGNKQITTEDIDFNTTYEADSTLEYKAQKETDGVKGTKAITTVYEVDPSTGLTDQKMGEPKVEVTKAAQNKVIKVGNKQVIKNEDGSTTTKIYEIDPSTGKLGAATEKTEPAPNPQPNPQPEPQPNPEAKPDDKPAPDVKPEQKPNPEVKPDDGKKPEVKPEQKPNPKAKPEDKPAPDAKPEQNPNPDVKPDDGNKPEVKPEQKPNPETQPKPEINPGTGSESDNVSTPNESAGAHMANQAPKQDQESAQPRHMKASPQTGDMGSISAILSSMGIALASFAGVLRARKKHDNK